MICMKYSNFTRQLGMDVTNIITQLPIIGSTTSALMNNFAKIVIDSLLQLIKFKLGDFIANKLT